MCALAKGGAFLNFYQHVLPRGGLRYQWGKVCNGQQQCPRFLEWGWPCQEIQLVLKKSHMVIHSRQGIIVFSKELL